MNSELSITFYIIAHQDDWQLFMTPNAYRDLSDFANKTIFIYTTAGDAGNDEQYWLAREQGALQSVKFALDTFFSAPGDFTNGQTTFCGHPIRYTDYKQTRSYFLRLPDGRMTGKGSEQYHYESLTKLQDGEKPSISAIDQSTTYQGWNDLCQTLAEIIHTESEKAWSVWVNASDYLLTNNYLDNADHTSTGTATKDAVELLGNTYWITFYRDYDIDLLPANLLARQVMWKTGIFAAYDVTMQAQADHCTRCENPFYMGWCLRQYTRQDHHNPITTLIGQLWAYILGLFTKVRGLTGAQSGAIAKH